MIPRMTVWALEGMPEVVEGADIATLIAEALAAAGDELVDGDILVVTSKIISKAEGRIMQAHDREEAITAETVRTVATRERIGGGVTRIVQNRLGIVGAAAGVDASNTPRGTVLLLPLDPDASAKGIATTLRASTSVNVGVVVSDTLGRPWREGQTDIAIGASGVRVFADLHGHVDSAGRPLVVTLPCIADEIAAAGDLVKGKLSGCPVAVVRGLGHLVGELDLPGASTIVRPAEKDLFRLGADEAEHLGYVRGLRDARELAEPSPS